MPDVDVVSLGECLVALVADEVGSLAEARSFIRHAAGAEANVCVGLARLGHRSAFIGRVGDDGFGRAIVAAMRAEGVDLTHVAVDPERPTGLLIRERRALGPAEVVYYRQGSAGSRIGTGDVEGAHALFAPGRWLHVTGITPALSDSCREALARALAMARDQAMPISLDLNVRRKLWSAQDAVRALRDLVRQATIVFADLDEAALVSGVDPGGGWEDPARALLALGAQAVVVKLGPDGAVVLTQHREPMHRPAVAVTTVVDPIGAGDAFAAGYLSALLDGTGTEGALDRANACGAFAISALGDMAGMATRAELERLAASARRDTWR